MDMQALWESGQLSWDDNDMLVLAPKLRKTKSVAVFDPFDRQSKTMKSCTKPGPVATFVSFGEARQLARVNKYGK